MIISRLSIVFLCVVQGARAALSASELPELLFAAVRGCDYAVVRDFEGTRGTHAYVIDPRWLDNLALILGGAKYTPREACLCAFFPEAEFYRGQKRLMMISVSKSGDAFILIQEEGGYFGVDTSVADGVGALLMSQKPISLRLDIDVHSRVEVPLPPLSKFGLTRR